MYSIPLVTNISSLRVERRLSESTSALQTSFERLSSGLRINHPNDDAAGLAISESLKADSRVLNQGVRNLNDGISVLNIADGALDQLGNIVVRLRELATEAANGTLGGKQRAALDKEAQGLSKEYNRIARTTSFNGVNLFDGTANDTTLQAGYSQLSYNLGGGVGNFGGGVGDGTFGVSKSYSTGTIPRSVAIEDFNGDGVADLVAADSGSATVSVLLGKGDGTFQPRQAYGTGTGTSPYSVAVGDFNGDGVPDLVAADVNSASVRVLLGNSLHGVSGLQSFSLTTQAGARSAITYFAQVQTRLSSQRGTVGAFESRAQFAVDTLRQASQEFISAQGRITDADVAEESATLVKNRILREAGAAVLADANQLPALALTLLRAA